MANLWRNSRSVEIILVGFCLVVAVWFGSIVTTMVGGVSATMETDRQHIRLQVVDAQPVKAVCGEAMARLEDGFDSALKIEVVDISRIGARKQVTTMLISRDKDFAAAERIAERLGLDPDGIVYRPMESNPEQISVTLVVGHDGIPKQSDPETKET